MQEFTIDYKELYNTSPCGYVCSLPNGKIIEVNNRFLEFTGYKRIEIINQKKIVDFLTKAGKIYFESSFDVILKLKGAVNELAFSFIKKDESRIPVLINSIDVKNKDGESIYIQTTIFDISQRKLFENQLLTAKKNADKLSNDLLGLNKEMESFAYVAAHDLKSPILDIEGHFDYLRNKLPLDDEYTQESIGFIDDSIKRFKITIEGLTKVIKLKNEKAIIEKVNLSGILNELLPSLKHKVEFLKGILKVSLKEDIMIQANSIFVTSILKNLIGNAIKYHSTERKLEIQVEGKLIDNDVCLTIKDNGMGIDLEMNKDKIFGMFNRFNDHTEGTGMGLYLTKKMLEQIGGKIAIHSEINIGSTFNIYFKRYDLEA